MRRGAGEGELFAAGDASLPALSMLQGVTVGVDVGGIAKGFHAVALRGAEVCGTLRERSVDAVVAWCLERNAAVVAVDAPCSWSATGKSRAAERALHAEGIHAFPTPALAIAAARPFYGWMLNGSRLYLALARHYALFDGGRRDGRMCFETYPQAVSCVLAGRILRAREKRLDRRALLAQLDVDIASLTNIDYVDAALCAVSGAYVRHGNFRAYGDPREGLIFVPARGDVTRREA